MKRQLTVLAVLAAALTGCTSADDHASDATPSTSEPAPDTSSSAPSESPTSGSTPTAPSSTASSPSAEPMVPDDFPLAEGMLTADDGSPATVKRTGRGMGRVKFCRVQPLREVAAVDRLVAAVSGPEYGMTRDLMTFPDADSAAATADMVVQAARECPVQSFPGGSEVLTEVRTSDLADPPSATLVTTYRQDGRLVPAAEIIQVVAVGPALLVTSSSAEWSPGEILEDAIVEDADTVRTVVEAMSGL